MRIATVFVFAFALVANVTSAQQTPPQDPTAPNSNNSSELQKIGGRISAPVVLYQPEAQFSDEARRAKYQGTCVLALIVDAHGNPQNVHVVRTLGMGLDEKAIEAVSTWRFKPAMKDGTTPVPVMITVEVDFHLYSGRKPDRSAAAIKSLPGSSTAQGKVKLPVIVNYVEPEYSDYGRKNRISGECVVGLTVATDGIPHNVRVIESLEPSLDQNAVAAVKQWVYKPATKDGHTVPFEGSVKIKFKLGGKLF
jgi:TonB family protein